MFWLKCILHSGPTWANASYIEFHTTIYGSMLCAPNIVVNYHALYYRDHLILKGNIPHISGVQKMDT